MAVIPEWDDKYIQEFVKDEFYRYYHKYEALDYGVRDQTAILFGHLDFKTSQLKIEHEFSISGEETTTRKIASGIDQIEKELGFRQLTNFPNSIFFSATNATRTLYFGGIAFWLIIINSFC